MKRPATTGSPSAILCAGFARERTAGPVARPAEDDAIARLAPLVVLWLLAGCVAGVVKDIEHQTYDEAAEELSAFCARNAERGRFWQRSRIEMLREIRQRGSHGPAPPDPIPEGLDERTAKGAGPVVMVWCRGETNGQEEPFPVPPAVWQNMIRDWRD